jgi:hypothetical protein
MLFPNLHKALFVGGHFKKILAMQETVNHQILKLINQQVVPTPATLLYDLADKLNYPIADFMHVVDSLIEEKYIAKKNETKNEQYGNIMFQLEESPRYIILPKGVDFIKSDNQSKNSINITGNVVGSQIGHESDFGYLESSHNSINLEPAIAKQQPIETSNIKTNLSIWDKIYKWTDHKLFSMIAYGLLYALATAFAGWLGWTIFK